MKRIIIIFTLFLSVFYSCEKDDFCTKNPVTPMLIIRFYDNIERSNLKNAELLSVWAEGKDTISEYKSITKDSIAIPLNSTALETIYHLKINSFDGNLASNQTETFTIQYTPEEKFVSRSCGFKVIFNDVTFTTNNNWIDDFTPFNLTSIENQSAAHVKIYH
ncbi:MAG: Uncharacterised protein [Polaribacter sp. SA4-10]|nr:MAG: Uncharacterised protein [Polaribacter sp. SA4-10]|tara:strand:- start:266 stop:751 length:486 start_codon:yes stop_codon:yes gene_type:complete